MYFFVMRRELFDKVGLISYFKGIIFFVEYWLFSFFFDFLKVVYYIINNYFQFKLIIVGFYFLQLNNLVDILLVIINI